MHIRKWYPDEEICNKKGEKPGWVKIQKRIKKKAKNRETYFTVEMLQAINKVYASIQGIDPDKKDTPEKWIARLKKRQQDAKKYFATLK